MQIIIIIIITIVIIIITIIIIIGMEQTCGPGAVVKVCEPWPEEIEALQQGSGQNHRPPQLRTTSHSFAQYIRCTALSVLKCIEAY